MSGRQYTPVRPPRGTKVSKDTSGRLMNIIAELSVSKSNDDRQKKMRELKNDFENSHTQLVRLIAVKKEYLSLTMDRFSIISSKINNSRKGCSDVKHKLLTCEKLLECKREDIRSLWFESLEHRDVINFLKDINDLSKVKERVENLLKEENFEESTKLVVSKISLFDGNLSSVDGLKDCKLQINTLAEILHEDILSKLYKRLYMLPENVNHFSLEIEMQQNKNISFEDMFNMKGLLGSAANSYENESKKEFSSLLDCTYKLKRLNETIDLVKEKCEGELMAIIHKSTVAASNAVNTTNSSNSDEKYVLISLLNLILNKFYIVGKNHLLFLKCLEEIKLEYGISDIIFDLSDVYSKMQAVIQIFVSTYVDFQNASATYATASTNLSNLAKVSPTSDISSYFLRKEVRMKKSFLFKFDCSSHAINMKSYLEEKKREGKRSDLSENAEMLVCEPTARNITVLFLPLKTFILELETALKYTRGSHCPLHTFVLHCVTFFLDCFSVEVNKMLEKSISSLETWKLASSDSDLKDVASKSEILESTKLIHTTLLDMIDLINALPDFEHHFLELVNYVLRQYKDESYKAFKGVIKSTDERDGGDERSIFSLSWAKDKDICRLLKSLPNWMNLKNMEPHTHTGGSDTIESAVSNEFEQSPSEVRYRNKEECDLLIRNLSCKDHVVLACEILRDYKKFKHLALLHESMEWISAEILKFSGDKGLPDVTSSNVEPFVTEKNSDESVSKKAFLEDLAKEFSDLADSCILVLHLEVRAHCFFYLLPIFKETTYLPSRKGDHEPEPDILKLNADLCAIDESISPILEPKKINYIFEGLGELLSTILINSVSHIKKINENGVKKMGRNIFAIQQNLAGITMTREVALDRARQYFDLLNYSLEDILNQIVEEGPQFQEQEYSAILQLLHNSREGIDSLSNYRDRLRQILDEVAVSV